MSHETPIKCTTYKIKMVFDSNKKIVLLAVAALLLLLVCIACVRYVRNVPHKRPRTHTVTIENFLNSTVDTLVYTGSYKPFTGKWHRVSGGFKGTRRHYQGMPHDHLQTPMGNTVWLHEGGTLAIYDQHVYHYPGGTRQAYIWSIGRWDPESGGVVGNERNAYAILDLANVPDVPHDATNLITYAETHGGANWGNTPEAEERGSFAPLLANETTEVAPPAAPEQTVTTPEPELLYYTGKDGRLRGHWKLQKQNLWYNPEASLALIRTPNADGTHHWHIQGWTPELDRLGITAGVLLSADDVRDPLNHVLHLIVAGEQTAFIAGESVANYRVHTPGSTNIPGFTAGARRRAILKVRVEDAYRRHRHH